MTFSEKNTTTQYEATMEKSPGSIEIEENAEFLNMNSTKKLAFYNHTPGAGKSYSYRLSGSSSEVVGPAKSLEVNAGDIVDLEVYARYANLTNTNSSVSTLLTSLISAFNLSSSGGTGLTGEDAYNSFSTMFSGGPVIGGAEDYEDEEAPKAYLNYILFDENFIPVDFGFDQISEAAGTAHEYLSLNVTVEQKGYLYIYLSNENNKLVDVFFDDLKVTHHTGVEQRDDYYAFGLNFNSYQRENSTANQYLYNGKEKQDELDLGWLDYGARMYQADLGKFFTQDRFAEKYHSYSPYQYAALNPIKYIDVNGDSTYLIVYGSGYASPNAKGQRYDVGDGFKKNAEARAEQLRKNLQKGDEVIVVNATTEDEYINALNTSYSSGVIKQLDVYSHGTNNSVNLGGPESGGPTETTEADKDYRLVSGFKSDQNPNGDNETARIDASNFSSNATINLWGCNLGGTKPADITSGANHAQYMANSLGGNVTVNAFNGGGGAEFKQSGGKNVYDGTMIRSADQKSQRTIQVAYKPR